MRSWGQVELRPFDPEPERTLHRLCREQREAQHRNLAIMQDIVEQDHGQEKNEPQRGHNGNNGRNQAARPFIQPDDPFMLLEEFALPPDGYPKTTYSGKQLRAEVSDLTDASEHPVPRNCQMRIRICT